jgi:hypothetical protein
MSHMASIDAWQGSTEPLSNWTPGDRGVDIARLIAAQPSSITVNRNGTLLSAQTVRVDPISGDSRIAGSQSGGTSRQRALVLGYRSHTSITDTDLRMGDRFVLDDLAYQVIELMPGLAECLQALAEVRG